MASSTAVAPPKDLSHLFSEQTKAKGASAIKRFYKYFSIPGIGQLAGGLPNSNYFPFDNLQSDIALPDRWPPTSNKPVDPPSDHLSSIQLSRASSAREGSRQHSSRLVVPHDSPESDRARKIDLATALQYGTAEGYPPLRSWLLQFATKHMHPQIPYAGGANIILTCGATDGFSKTVECFNNTWVEGKDPISTKEGLLIEEFAYQNAIQTARPRGMNIASVKIDNEGMLADGPGGLEDVLENWDFSKGKRPHMLYTVTIGQNPTSGVLSVERRKVIYELCCKFDIVIAEDDPYWFLQYPSANSSLNHRRTSNTTGFDFLDSLVPSYLSVDTEGRVIRLDTFSKTIAPGCRLGWVTAQPAVIERLLRITETSTQQPSGFVQSMVAQLLVGPSDTSSSSHRENPGKGGGAEGHGFQPAGWVRWLEGLRGNYERRMNAMCDIFDEGQYRVRSGRRPSSTSSQVIGNDEWAFVEKQNKPMYTFQRPMGGMFIWMQIRFENHPLWDSELTPEELSHALWILWTRKPSLLLVSPGEMFAGDEDVKARDGWRFFRICFAACDEELVVPLSRRFVTGVQKFWAVRDTKTIKKLLDSDREDEPVNEGIASLAGVC